ncbi:BamA/TamA family outer membrane protein [Colwellia echini]|uniref:BamA/TamA family outer membrane protein n=1 Tax=Colwellia echini TaxID=1982103 RepID=A0ABY3MXU3_9GAMM|nr:BamA/TamA family outer membrane protein [Colwellia echini]TYK65981.1 BamA/TamA family outer membrane protein [Colwellia echini]
MKILKSNKSKCSLFLLLCISLSCFAATEPQEKPEKKEESLFIDEQDGDFDVSKFLASKQGFLPVPIIITGPTFGYGLGVNALFLHGSLQGKKSKNGHYIPPGLSGVVAAGTENGTRFAAAYHLGFYLDGDLRSTTFIGAPNANMDFGTKFGDVNLNFEGYAAYQELKYRVLNSQLFAGFNYTYMQVETKSTDGGEIVDDLFSRFGDNTYAGLAAVLEYDTRDSIFTPNKGVYAKGVIDFYNQDVGSDSNFVNYRLKAFYFKPVSEKFILGFRTEFQTISGEDKAPVFMTPSIVLRGISNSQYIGQSALVAEIEGRYEVAHRHWAVGFTGSGRAYGDYSSAGKTSFSDAKWHSSYGVGYRYELARKFKLLAGIDIAKSETDTAFYITVGSAWNAFY